MPLLTFANSAVFREKSTLIFGNPVSTPVFEGFTLQYFK